MSDDDIDVEKWLEAPYQQGNQKSNDDKHSNGTEEKKKKRKKDEDRSRSRKHKKRRKSSPSTDRHRKRSRSNSIRKRRVSVSRSPNPVKRFQRPFQPPNSNHFRRRSPSPSNNDPERDKRTVFVMQLAARLTNSELREFFEDVGRIKAVKIIMDKNNRRSKGLFKFLNFRVGYVEFAKEESVPKAIKLSGQKLLGIPIIVQASESEKNKLAMESLNPYFSASKVSENAIHRLFVGNINRNIIDDDLKLLSKEFGKLEFVALQRDEQRISKGYAFVQYDLFYDAENAKNKLDGFELAGQKITVGFMADKTTELPPGVQAPIITVSNSNKTFFRSNKQDDYHRNNREYDRPLYRERRSENDSRRDDRGRGGRRGEFKVDVDEKFSLNSKSRYELMKKLAREKSPETKSDKKEKMVTKCMVIKSMFDPVEESQNGENWKEDILSDITTEISKYATILHVDFEIVSTNSADVFFMFKSSKSSQNVYSALNGRWFNKRQLEIDYVPDFLYNTKFPKAAKL